MTFFWGVLTGFGLAVLYGFIKAWAADSSPRVCPDTGEVCRIGVCNDTPKSPCENQVFRSRNRPQEGRR